jgi:hypothetical protein
MDNQLSSRPASAVRGLPLPGLLLQLIASGRWRHPGDQALAEVMPWFEDPLDFLHTAEGMERESASMDTFADDSTYQLFREARGSAAEAPVELPWLDIEQAVFIAVCRHAGDDVALALDYRTDLSDPAVVGSDFWTDPRRCAWRVVAPTFSAFATALGLLPPEHNPAPGAI